jgi:hypothetical protein
LSVNADMKPAVPPPTTSMRFIIVNRAKIDTNDATAHNAQVDQAFP